MRTLLYNDRELRAGLLAKPVRVYQPHCYTMGPYYTAIPMDMLDSVRAMLKACGFKLKTFYVGHRPATSLMDQYYRKHRPATSWSVTSATTRKSNARYAKIMVIDPATNKRAYL